MTTTHQRSLWAQGFLGLALLALLAPPLGPAAVARAGAPAATLRYLAPVPGSHYLLPANTVALRLDGDLNPATLTADLFTVTGGSSGAHAGTAHVALDGRTAIFDPTVNFSAGELVTVTIASGLTTMGGTVWPGTTFTFTVSSMLAAQDTAANLEAELTGTETTGGPLQPASPTGSLRVVDPADYVTLSDAMPVYTVTGSLSGAVTDTYALGLIPWGPYDDHVYPSHLLLLDGTGEPVYYQTLPANGWGGIDFKRQPGGQLSYYSEADFQYHLLDDTYTEVGAVGAQFGYETDLHELQLLPNGEALFMIYDPQRIDMSQVILGGDSNAKVLGLVIQAVDANQDVVFQWRSWDHFLLTDTVVSLTAANIDYVHGNAIEVDDDGNLLLSSRHLDEITKINRDTGAIMWRWGGPNNEFTMDPAATFYHQHDIRRQADGTLTLFDNHNDGPASRGLTFELDEINLTATLVDEQLHAPDIYSLAMGSHSVAADGTRLLGWGSATTTLTEYAANGSVRLEVSVSDVYRSYRAARFAWVGHPAWPPTLVLTDTTALAAGAPGLAAGGEPGLFFSWNGATEVGSYEVFALGPTFIHRLAEVPRTAFEDHVLLAAVGDVPDGTCAYRVRALDHAGHPLAFSNLVYPSAPCSTWQAALPLVLQLPAAANALTGLGR